MILSLFLILIGIIFGWVLYAVYRNYYVFTYYRLNSDDISAGDNKIKINKLGYIISFDAKEISKIKIIEDKDGYWTVTIIRSLLS